MAEGHTVIAFDVEADCRREMAAAGIVMTSSVQAVLLHLPKEKTVHVVMAEGSAREAMLKLLASELGPEGRILTEEIG